jgi:hypothetical protein
MPPGAPPPTLPSAPETREKARAAMAAGDVAGACVSFEASYQQAKSPGSGVTPDEVLFELAACHDRLGKHAVAASEYDQVAAAGGPQAAEAKARAAALRTPATPAVTVAPPAPEVPQAPVATQKPSSPTRIGDFMDTRLSWTFGDDDVLHSTGQTYPLSPNASIGDRTQYRLFFDNLNSRFSGRENLTHLALYKALPGYIKGLDTEASLVLRFDIAALATNTNNVNQALYDAGTFIRAFYHIGSEHGTTGIGVTFWPIDTDRFRLGYLYDNSWGGTNAAINQSIFPRIQGSAPGAKLQFDAEKFSLFLGFKTATIEQVQQTLTPGTSEQDIEEIRVGETNYGVLAGGSTDPTDFLHFDINGGYFQQGKFDLPDVEGQSIYTYGFSMRAIAHHKDMPVPQSIDYLLYRNDPDKPMVIFAPEVYFPDKTTWLVSAEFTNLFQKLKDFDNTGATKIQPARAAAIQAQIKSGYARASLTGIYRDLPFVLRNQPSFIPFETLPKAATTTNEIFVAGAFDYYLRSVRLTPGIGAGVQFPATFKSTTVDSASEPIDRTVVVRQQGDIAILPVGKGAVPVVEARVSLKWDLSDILSAVVWVQYKRDNNSTFVERDPSEGTVSLRTFVDPDFLGLGTSVQARF